MLAGRTSQCTRRAAWAACRASRTRSATALCAGRAHSADRPGLGAARCCCCCCCCCHALCHPAGQRLPAGLQQQQGPVCSPLPPLPHASGHERGHQPRRCRRALQRHQRSALPRKALLHQRRGEARDLEREGRARSSCCCSCHAQLCRALVDVAAAAAAQAGAQRQERVLALAPPRWGPRASAPAAAAAPARPALAPRGARRLQPHAEPREHSLCRQRCCRRGAQAVQRCKARGGLRAPRRGRTEKVPPLQQRQFWALLHGARHGALKAGAQGRRARAHLEGHQGHAVRGQRVGKDAVHALPARVCLCAPLVHAAPQVGAGLPARCAQAARQPGLHYKQRANGGGRGVPGVRDGKVRPDLGHCHGALGQRTAPQPQVRAQGGAQERPNGGVHVAAFVRLAPWGAGRARVGSCKGPPGCSGSSSGGGQAARLAPLRAAQLAAWAHPAPLQTYWSKCRQSQRCILTPAYGP